MAVFEVIEPLKKILREHQMPVLAGQDPFHPDAGSMTLHSHCDWELILCTDHIQLNPPGIRHHTSRNVEFSFFFDARRISCSLRAKKIFYRWRIPDTLLPIYFAPELLSLMMRCLPEQLLSEELFRAAVASLIHLLQKIDQTPQDASYRSLARLLIEYLQQHYYQSTLSSDDLEETFCMSSQYLNRALHAEGFPSIHAMLTKIRLEKAAELLKSGEYSVADVAQRTGWQSPFYFSNRFRKYFGTSPRLFQQKNQINPFHRSRLI